MRCVSRMQFEPDDKLAGSEVWRRQVWDDTDQSGPDTTGRHGAD